MVEMGEEAFLRETLRDSAPAWLNFPDVERAEWVNTAAAILWPHVGRMADTILRREVEPRAREVLDGYKLYGFKFEQVRPEKKEKTKKNNANENYVFSSVAF